MKNTQLEPIRLIGLRLAGKTSNENGQSSKDCGELWQKFEKEAIADQIAGKLNNAIYAVYFDYDGDENQPFSYFIGCAVPENVTVPTGLQTLTIPSQTYQRFLAKGVMPECITDIWKSIWSSNVNRSFTFDFEVYDERSANWSDAEVDVFIAID
ncbi:transcriptional regulator [Roseivirga spongicola]|uniref:Transcriptional regulator n=1 Tax=Roseivirga spongicola TaxID=333140 RepID=A0A150XDN0_9BACT|nr:GyrI-like domain-containing protein [Roseivirga spongicola]KYG76849.1 transcriptional regulator [Roseivirga spongicola]